MLTEANAFISIDVEDWYHLEYFKGSRLSHNVTCIDGLHTFIETLDRHQIKGNFFFLDEFALSNRELITELCYQGHGIGSHGSGHVRPVTLSVKDFYKSLQGSYSVLRSIVPSWKPIGYRAPCFALDDERLELVAKAGFSYDSSYIQCGQHP
jgi:peptidoglycan/xylan/chitin deacetylase (PgdA/CDA1 family)